MPVSEENQTENPESLAGERSRGTFSREELIKLRAQLEAIVEDRGLLLPLSRDELQQLLEAAGKVAHPGRAAKRRLVKASRKQRKDNEAVRKTADEGLLAQTGIRANAERAALSPRRLQGALPQPLSESQLAGLHQSENASSSPEKKIIGKLEQPRNCYICKTDYHELHFFYDSMCLSCAQFNWTKRNQSADLSGRYAVVTGARVKIGFEASLKLLRAGCHVIATTRFPHDSIRRYREQPDSSDWWARLQVVGLDMRHTPSVESFASHLADKLPTLGFVLNNACQTVRRPPGFYRHLIAEEERVADELSRDAQKVLEFQSELVDRAGDYKANSNEMMVYGKAAVQGIENAAALSQIAMIGEDHSSEAFPAGKYDSDQQQIDLRDRNSWRLKLDEVSTVELLEVHLVNAVAPYILNARLRSLMKRKRTDDKHIVNVSAMEGVFYRAFKRDTHPHTNMAKAALNMMTRTSAIDYLQDGIHMNSVDTGWITDEDPIEITQRKKREHGFSPPLDLVDAAARICDPIFHGVLTGEHHWGKFLKDYRISNW